MSRRLLAGLVMAGVVGGAALALATLPLPAHEGLIGGVVDCPGYGLVMGRLLNPGAVGYDSPAEAADEVRQAILADGGRPDGRAVEPFVDIGNDTFLWPRPGEDLGKGDGFVEVEPAPGGGYLATTAYLCADAVPEGLTWGTED